MGLISKEVEVTLNSMNIKYYEDLGYEIPRRRNNGRLSTPRGTKILVKVEDLPKCSNIRVKVKCDCCNKEYDIIYQEYSKQNHNKKIYCNKCSSKILISGEKHFNWNFDLTEEERNQKRKYSEYTEFVKKVLKRDNYTCKCCDKHTNNAEVHHLDGYDWCKQKRTDETNGITLCKTCHKNFHTIYGYGNNTREQFEEWIGHAIGELEKYNGKLPTARKVYCIEEDKIYDSIEELAQKWGLKSISSIYNVCDHRKTKKGYRKSIQGKHILWLDEYEKCTEADILKYLNWCKPNNKKEIYCITTGKLFNSTMEASRYYNCCNTSICQCCTGKRNYCGKLEDGTKLQWQYYEDYLKEQQKSA
ncbi:HNH endonuclease [Clostridium butyricum]